MLAFDVPLPLTLQRRPQMIPSPMETTHIMPKKCIDIGGKIHHLYTPPGAPTFQAWKKACLVTKRSNLHRKECLHPQMALLPFLQPVVPN
jgi:hypothetical protein